MKKFILALTVAFLATGAVFAQDMKTATETAKNGNDALEIKDFENALNYFKEALNMAEACGEEGQELVGTCKSVIPSILRSWGKALFNDKNFADAITKFEEAKKVADEYGDEEVSIETEGLIQQTKILQVKTAGDNAVKEWQTAARAKDNEKAKAALEAAVKGYKEWAAIDSENSDAFFKLGDVLQRLGDFTAAKEAFATAAEKGADAAKVNAQLSNIYLKEGQALVKANKLADAITAFNKSNELQENANAFYLLGQIYSKQQAAAKAIAAYEKFVEVAPTDQRVGGVTYTLGVLYENTKNKAKALENYNKILTDAKYGAEAKKGIERLNK